ncbi:four helix bundle protein [Flavipsychrobacter stenotrophus]|uniref:Four helix bundle protein n=1 Tax=Flavipsychrobacter stenotrophus TaxID=2077091 RepID=A0A2S7SUI2_9BACT|nr:four helix bundle protein [Flavipsychrobacter stenotrophus]PQJ10582.1 four helix bundle protein [Flavipsychrobacter stenotrophus]
MEQTKPYKSFNDLEVWKAARLYKKAIYDLSITFPSTEKYRLEDQMIRASRSIGSNIAEGYGRYTYKDQLHFCIQARGSLFETVNHLIDAYDCKYIDKETLQNFKNQANEVEKLLNGYIAWLRTLTKS